MREGLLWFDSDPQRKLADKVGQAARRYRAKFGRQPTTCYLNTADFDGQTDRVKGIRLRAVTNVLRHHYWIGVDTDTITARTV